MGSAAPDTSAVNAGDLIFCPEVQRRLSQSDCDDLTRVADAAKQGTAAFNVPELERGKATTLQLAISFALPEIPLNEATDVDDVMGNAADAAPTNMTDDMSSGVVPKANRPVAAPRPSETPEDIVGRLPGEVESYQPVVGRFMRATLVGEGFEIKPLSEVSQEVFITGSTTWEWSVTPLKAEHHVLTLKTIVEGVTADGKRFALRSTTRTRNVDVKLNWVDRVRDYLEAMPGWLKAVSGVIAGLTTLVGATLGFKALFGKKPTKPAA
jgi:hypothetical protein